MHSARIVFVAILLSATTLTAEPAGGFHPCRDSLYSALKSRDINSLTDREYAYLMQREEACLEYLGRRAERTTTVAEDTFSPPCTLIVRMTANATSSEMEPIALYVDDVSFGEMQRARVLTSFEPGHHTVGLYTTTMVADLRAKAKAMHSESIAYSTSGQALASAFQLDEAEEYNEKADQLSTAIVKVRLVPGKSTTVHFRLNCDTGGNRRCDNDEWFFTTTVSNPQ